ncbi:Ppx/GppA phosphatase family protein [Rhizobium sp. FY34]|uniref:Ppx/GppA phosphatase family protein n=1 Tax=Rhizobium sp. FY34 TaxID=2562309 RepID=UPI001FEF3471|nr:Ppx/GppA phosphatase family protein [Rhizobium sp. FY34]
MNPDSGGKPPEGGASSAERPAGKTGRRRKAKRSGKPPSAGSAVRGVDAVENRDARRPETKDASLARKRKRRRSRASPNQGAAAANAAGQPAHGAQDAATMAGSKPVSAGAAGAGPGHAVAEKATASSVAPREGSRRRGRSKKNKEGRSLQGRPLAPSGKSGGKSSGHSGHAGPTGHGGHGHHGQHASTGHASGGPAHAQHHPHAGRAGPEHRPRAQALNEAGDASRRRSHPDDLYAALDLGTNNCRLLIAQPTRPGQFRVVDAFSRIVRLGEGLAATGRLSQEAMDRAVEALRICAVKLANRPVRKMRLIATEACRAAENGEEFLARVTRETGLELEIIDRETEARLAVSGCSSLVGREARSVVLFDIGGGSSEIAVLRIRDNRSSRLANHITHWTSLPVGVVTLSERHGGQNVTPDVFAAMVAEVEGMLSAFECPPIGEDALAADEDFHLIGTSGTVTTLAGVHLDLPRYDRRKVDGLWLSDAEVSAMQAKLLSWDFEGRATNPCIGPDRADLVLAGCAILEAIRRRWPSPRMRVADRGLREGLLTDMMADDGVWRRFRGRRNAETTARSAPENPQ